MKVVIADFSAAYEGRGRTTLPRGIRSIILKGDGSISIHNDESNKPLNYMKKAAFSETTDEYGNIVWSFEARNELLQITMFNKIAEMSYDLMEDDPGLTRDGTEAQLQAWIAENVPLIFGDDFTFIEREFQTGHGAVDLLLTDPDGTPVCVEVKRTALLGVVYQTKRYVDSAQQIVDHPEYQFDFSETYGMIVGIDIRPKTLVFSEKHNITCLHVPQDWRNQGTSVAQE